MPGLTAVIEPAIPIALETAVVTTMSVRLAKAAAANLAVTMLIREIGFEPVNVGPLAMGKYLIPGTPLAGEHSPDEIRKIAATLK